jgi:hypothetical protein
MKVTAKEAVGITTIESVDKWADISLKFARALGVAAKELGIAANDFLKTPAGMLTAGVIVFQYMGGPIIHVSIGLFILITGLGLLTWFARTTPRMVYTYDLTNKNWLGNHPLIGKERKALDGEIGGGILLGYAVVLVVGVWTIFAW